MDSFCKNQKKWKNGCFLDIFGLHLAMFLTSQQYEFDEITHKGPSYSVEGLYKNSFESYGQFLRKSKKSKNSCFLGIFGFFLAMFLTSQSYEFSEIAQEGS